MVHRFDFWVLIILLVPWSILFLGFFGEQAIRLLQPWDRRIRADKSGDIRPRGATLLAQELFAMMDDGIPQTQNAPVTFNQSPLPAIPGAVPIPPVTINAPGGTAIQTDGKVHAGSIEICKEGTGQFQGHKVNTYQIGSVIGGRTSESENQTLAQDSLCKPAVQLTPKGATVNGDMNVNEGFYLWNGVPLDMGAKTSVFLGKVVSGTGDTYIVDLYGKGSTQDPTVRGVTVTIPQIDPSEKIPVGTWLGAVHKFKGGGADQFGNSIDVYESQPPIWLL